MLSSSRNYVNKFDEKNEKFFMEIHIGYKIVLKFQNSYVCAKYNHTARNGY